MVIDLRETNKQIVNGKRVRGRPLGSKKLYGEIDRNTRIKLLPVVIQGNENLKKYLLSESISHLQIVGSRCFVYLIDSSFFEV